MVMLELENYVYYGIGFIQSFHKHMGWPYADDLFNTDEAEVAILKLLNEGLAVIPCNPDDPRMETDKIKE